MVKKLRSRILGRTGLHVSEIGLGTAEIGLIYGIGRRDLPNEDQIISFVRRVVELDVTFIDTAPFYGAAERHIGRSGVARRHGVIVGTKCGHVLDRQEAISNEDLARTLTDEVEESLRRLELDVIPLVQVHGGSTEQIRESSIISTLQKLKDAGKVQHVGISTRGEEAALAAIESGFFDVLQVAHSILDQRMVARVLPKAKEKNIGIINRSTLLKGALTPASRYLSGSLALLKETSDAAAVIAEEIGTTLPALAVRFALSNDAVSTVLVGSNKIENVEHVVAAAQSGALPQDILDKLRALAIDDPLQVDPRHWSSDMLDHSWAGRNAKHESR